MALSIQFEQVVAPSRKRFQGMSGQAFIVLKGFSFAAVWLFLRTGGTGCLVLVPGAVRAQPQQLDHRSLGLKAAAPDLRHADVPDGCSR